MKTWMYLAALLLATVSLAAVCVEDVPEKGLQPQVVAADGAVHLVYLTGDPKACDVRYVRRANGAKEWSAPIRVNSEANTAVALGTIRGAQIAVGQGGSVHVVWNGPNRMKDGVHVAPLLYARLAAGGSGFEAQRDLGADKPGLDGGASVAANARGEVFVAWHAREHAEAGDETARVVFVRKSTNDGVAFSNPVIANADFKGVCACCSVRASAPVEGGVHILYRPAHTLDQRGLTLLTSRDGMKFERCPLDAWTVKACPMSSAAIITARTEPFAAWENDGVIWAAPLRADAKPVSISTGKAKHPALASNTGGDTLAVWITGSGWARGGNVMWTLLGANGQPTQAGGVPAWSFAAAYAEPNGDFVILR